MATEWGMRSDGGEGAASDVAEGATLTVGPTSEGMVRLLVQDGGMVVPMDFEPDEAEEIADELRAAAALARGQAKKGRGS